jgi:nucleoside-diphosphate-sugar epimerase
MDLAARLQSGHWAMYGGYGDGLCNLVYIDDLISAVLVALTNPRAIGQAFNIVGPKVVTWNEYFARFNAALGRPELQHTSSSRSRLKSAATDLVRASSKLALSRLREPIDELRQRFDWAEEMAGQLKGWVKSTPTTRELELLYSRQAVYVALKAKNLLGYQPQFNLETGLTMSVRWLDHQGLVKRTVERVAA